MASWLQKQLLLPSDYEGENDPNTIHPDNPEAAANIIALARRRGGS